MKQTIRKHLRLLLLNYKKNKQLLDNLSSVLLDDSVYLTNDINQLNIDEDLSLKRLINIRKFIQTVDLVLSDSTDDVKDLVESKYFNGYRGKKNDIVSHEINLSESTVKRRDSEFLEELAYQLGW